ncbi:hypothetical protein FPV67DRAFT_1628168 [Lyophyllum atratum]|nr:hypothetical protein FPV67DRAFT_1628168 [Lyophyllum atratum]
MRFSLAVLALTAASASASVLSRQAGGIPECALPCLAGPDVDLHGCAGNDNACLCKNADFISESTACITKACESDPAQLQQAITLAQGLCAAVGVTLTSAPATTAATSAPATSPTATRPTTSAPTTGTSSGAAPAQTSNGARTNTAGAFAGIAAFGLAALAL